MKIHEYQAKELFQNFGIPVPNGKPVDDLSSVSEMALQVHPKGPWVLKAQIHAGGRGKVGGIQVCKTLSEVKQKAQQLFGKVLITPQTGSQGRKVQHLLIEEACSVDQEFYLAVVLDRSKSSLAVVASPRGGMDIEEVSAHNPEQIFSVSVDPSIGFSPFQARTLAFGMELNPSLFSSFSSLVSNMVRLFLEKDCSLVEINPLGLTSKGNWLAMDAKINLDDNALFRHPDLQGFHDPGQEDFRDLAAAEWGLNYIGLEGNIGCMVNGAGLAMATMDIIKLCGGSPANFLDVGGAASQEMVREAFSLLSQDTNVKAILVNIFGGIVRCDILAQGIGEAISQLGVKLPIIVRLEGTHSEEGKKILASLPVPIQTAKDMETAAKWVVKAAQG